MGAKLIPLLLALCLLCGCSTEERYIPYYVTDSGAHIHATDTPAEHDKQVLEFCEGEYSPLYHTTLNFYSGDLYALSNYRARLLALGWETISLTQTSELLDTVLTDGTERVRLIYQNTGVIRIVFENQSGAAHILLEEV